MSGRHEPSPVCKAASIESKYELWLDKVLGEGGFAKVVEGKVKSTGAPVAVKVVQRGCLKGKRYAMMCHEREILRFARHPNIIRLHECIETSETIYMVMEKMDTDLYEYVKRRETLGEGSTSKIIAAVLRGVAYLHDNCIAHRDIKPENILLNDENTVKLADFGVAKVLESWSVDATPIGTSYYMAPEVIRGIQLQGLKPRQTTRDELKFVDIWSTGVVAYILLCGVPPFYGAVKTKEERDQLLRKIDQGVLFPASHWDAISTVAKDFIAAMLTVNTSERLSARTALQHRFFTNYDSLPMRGGGVPAGAAVKLSRSEVKAHLETLINTCDSHLDPEGAATDAAADALAPPLPSPLPPVDLTPLPKPDNPMKLRRSRRPPPSPGSPPL